jgi:hypothetical protein
MKSLTKVITTSLTLSLALMVTSCGSKKSDPTPTNPPAGVTSIAISDLKKLSTAATVVLPDGKQITGVVISDVTNKNIDAKTVVLQEATGKSGIVINFAEAQAFAPGDNLTVNVSKQTLAQVSGEIVLNNVPAENAKKTGTGTILTQKITAGDVAKNAAALDGTLVTLPAGSFTGGGGKYSGSLTYTDASGSVKSLVLAGASFENKAYVLSADSLTGIVRVSGTDSRVDIRNTGDVYSGITKTISEDFSTAVVSGVNFTTTPTGNWLFGANGDAGGYLITPLSGDSFLKAGSKYMYLTNTGATGVPVNIRQTANLLTTGYEGQLSGLKNISVTFAGSNFSGTFPYDFPNTNPRPFDPAKDKSGVAVYLCTPGDGENVAVEIGSASYGDAGVLHTFNVKIPGNVQELQALFIAEGLSNDEAVLYSNDIFNYGKIVVGFVTISTNRDTDNASNGPVVITNLGFGLGN